MYDRDDGPERERIDPGWRDAMGSLDVGAVRDQDGADEQRRDAHSDAGVEQPATAHEENEERPQKIELFLDRDGPQMREVRDGPEYPVGRA